MAGNLTQRIAFAALAIPAAVGIVWWGGLPLAALLAVAGALGVREVYDLAGRRGVMVARPLGLLAAAGVGPLVWAYHRLPGLGPFLGVTWPLIGAIWLLAVFLWILWRVPPDGQPLAAASITVMGVLYAATLPSLLIVIRHRLHAERSWEGTWLVFLPLVITWVCDTTAMFAGRAIGGPRLAPVVSPGKTRAGAIAGLVGGVIAAMVFTALTGLGLTVGEQVLFGVVLSALAQAGDLVESLFKREAGVKDSSALIPGHGGVLDRFDALYFVVPAALVLYQWFGVL